MKKTLSIIAATVFCVFNILAQSYFSTQPHSGSINALAIADNAVYTAGQDGFIIKWTTDGSGEHYQLSDLEIKMIAVNPLNNNLAIYETDGYSVNRVSVWDWEKHTRKFAKRLSDSISSLNFSANGAYLMIGTNAIDGIIFLDANRGAVLRKVKESPRMVTYSVASKSGKTSFMYTPLGYMIYTDLTKGTTKREIAIETNLSNPLLFNNNLMFAGYKDGYIYIYHSMNDTILARIKAKNPIFISGENDEDLYYVEPDGKNYSLKMIQTEGTEVFADPLIVKNFGINQKSQITCVKKSGNIIVAACKNGTVHYTSAEPETEFITLAEISERVYENVCDVANFYDTFYFLTESSLFSGTQESGLTEIMKNKKYTNMLPTENGFILWAKNTSTPLAYCSEENGWTPADFFTPSISVQNLHYENEKLIVLEGSSTVNLYDFNTKQSRTIFKGTGVQDAILFSDDDLYVAKSASTSPKSALLHVDVKTQETVALPINAETAFSLSKNTAGTVFYGVSVYSGSSRKTDIFSYTPATGTYSAILQWGDEDTQAFTWFNNGKLYTNIGKTQIRALSISTKKESLYARNASLPVKLAGDKNKLLVLNKDGSISWFDAKTNAKLANCHITLAGEWLEF